MVNRFAQEIRLGVTWYLHLRCLQNGLPLDCPGKASGIPVISFPGYRKGSFTYAAVWFGRTERLQGSLCCVWGAQGQHCRAELAATGARQGPGRMGGKTYPTAQRNCVIWMEGNGFVCHFWHWEGFPCPLFSEESTDFQLFTKKFHEVI